MKDVPNLLFIGNAFCNEYFAASILSSLPIDATHCFSICKELAFTLVSACVTRAFGAGHLTFHVSTEVAISNLGNIILTKIADERLASNGRTSHLVTSIVLYKYGLALWTTAFARIRHRFMSLMRRIGLDEFLPTMLLT